MGYSSEVLASDMNRSQLCVSFLSNELFSSSERLLPRLSSLYDEAAEVACEVILHVILHKFQLFKAVMLDVLHFKAPLPLPC